MAKWIVGVKELKQHHDYNVNKDTIKTLSDLLCLYLQQHFSSSRITKWKWKRNIDKDNATCKSLIALTDYFCGHKLFQSNDVAPHTHNTLNKI